MFMKCLRVTSKDLPHYHLHFIGITTRTILRKIPIVLCTDKNEKKKNVFFCEQSKKTQNYKGEKSKQSSPSSFFFRKSTCCLSAWNSLKLWSTRNWLLLALLFFFKWVYFTTQMFFSQLKVRMEWAWVSKRTFDCI